jgi:hypothetical protein
MMGDDHREASASLGGNGEMGARMRAEPASATKPNVLSTGPTATSDLTSILYEILDAIIELQGADLGLVQLYDEATRTLKIVGHRGMDQGFLDYFATADAGETSACGLALRSMARIVIEDVNTDPDFEPHRHIAPRDRISRRAIDAVGRSGHRQARWHALNPLSRAAPPVCTENSNPDVMMVKPGEDRV